jgi:hypothetical protein
VGVVERGGRLRLHEAGAAARVGETLARQHLDRHLAPEPQVARAVHLAHAARPERRDHLEHPETGAGREHDLAEARVGLYRRGPAFG